MCSVVFQAAMTPFVGAFLGGAGFSLSIRAKLGLRFLRVSAVNRTRPSPTLSPQLEHFLLQFPFCPGVCEGLP
jgi:hypothetical protein